MIGNLPDQWVSARLGACLKRRRDTVMPATIDADFVNIVGLEDIEGGGRGGIAIKKMRPADAESLKTRFYQGDILYGKLRPYLNKVGIASHDGLCSTEIWAFVTESFVDPYFVYAFLSSPIFVERVSGLTKGANLPRLDLAAFDAVEMPVPPLSEQRRIVSVLQTADGIASLQDDAQELIATLASDLFSRMTADASSRFPVVKLADLAEEFRYGTSRSSSDTGAVTLRIPNVLGDRISFDDVIKVQESERAIGNLRLKSGDMLFVRTNGNPEYIGRCAVFDQENADRALSPVASVIYASYLIRARVRQDLIRPWYSHAFLRSPLGRASVLRQARTAAGQYNINIEGLKSIKVPVPSLDVQDRVITRLEISRDIAEEHRSAVATYSELWKSLLASAFSGKLSASWRKRHVAELTREVAERDGALKSMASVGRGALVGSDSILDGSAYADDTWTGLTRDQVRILKTVRRCILDIDAGVARDDLDFTANEIAGMLIGSLHNNIQAVESNLAVLVARGLVVALSREQRAQDTDETVYGNCYRLAVGDPITDQAEGGEPPIGGAEVRDREIRRLLGQAPVRKSAP